MNHPNLYNPVLITIPLAICHVCSSVSVHFSFAKIAPVLCQTPLETDAESKIQRLLEETWPGSEGSRGNQG